MNRIMNRLLWVTVLASLTSWAEVPATLKDLSFIAGHWRGEMGGTVIEEVWMPPEGDAMYSLFRMVGKGRTQFTEFQALEQRGENVVLVLRHFGAGLIAREDKESPLVWTVAEVAANRVVFHQTGTTTQLEYARDGDQLTITLIKERDGKMTKSPFRMKLATAFQQR